jgi:hypothetical protein
MILQETDSESCIYVHFCHKLGEVVDFGPFFGQNCLNSEQSEKLIYILFSRPPDPPRWGVDRKRGYTGRLMVLTWPGRRLSRPGSTVRRGIQSDTSPKG